MARVCLRGAVGLSGVFAAAGKDFPDFEGFLRVYFKVTMPGEE